MIGNKYLEELFNYPDEDTALNQLLEMLKNKDEKFINSLNEPINLTLCDKKEIEFLTKVSALIDYYLQIHGLEVPDWLRDDKLSFKTPYYHPRRISDFDKIKLQITCPGPFRARNVYFDMSGLERV